MCFAFVGNGVVRLGCLIGCSFDAVRTNAVLVPRNDLLNLSQPNVVNCDRESSRNVFVNVRDAFVPISS